MSAPLILVVDDERDFRAIVTHILERAGYATVSAADGEEGLRVFSEKRPSLVVLDGNLPDIDGLEVCRRLRATKAGASVPVLMCTVRSSLPIVREGLDAGVTDYVLKPFEAEDLVTRVRSALEAAKSA